MKNQKLKIKFLEMRHDTNSEIQVLSSNDELSLIGGNCPMLMTCGTYTSCSPKYKILIIKSEVEL